MVRIALREIIPPAQNNPEISPNGGPTIVRRKNSANAAGTRDRKEQKTIITPGKGGIPAGGATAAGAGRIMGLLGRMEMMPQKAISSE